MHARERISDVIMSATASQITGLSMVSSTVCWGADQRKHQSSASLAFVRGIHRSPVNSSHKGPVTRKMFPFDDVIMHRCVIKHCTKITLFPSSSPLQPIHLSVCIVSQWGCHLVYCSIKKHLIDLSAHWSNIYASYFTAQVNISIYILVYSSSIHNNKHFSILLNRYQSMDI